MGRWKVDEKHREIKAVIREFMRRAYTDERLAMLLAHAQEGRLRHDSCCCLASLPFVKHTLISGWCRNPPECAQDEQYEVGVSYAFNRLIDFSRTGDDDTDNAARRRILIPMIRAEMQRRDRARAAKQLGVIETENFAEVK
jgi:hypothetical protein